MEEFRVARHLSHGHHVTKTHETPNEAKREMTQVEPGLIHSIVRYYKMVTVISFYVLG